ncbi:hypothetical protein [Lacisediminihabitans changchengi]|uniref:DUF2076 domain-containing protein n=1 Tax=Lacisediminihabitans changchengi TaxID=2787634 RepID=A0A934W0R3_9MICO|nr:hypothetical protein [Lacisediminihabitans changchengi]MBK4346113.1 hypothetical protein [Lacisediminihabitans changchengi]
MGFLDRLLGREEDPPVQQRQAAPQRTASRSDDEIAVERYQYLLRTAPPETIEQVHTEAFTKLTPKQRDILFEQLTKNATTASERPANAEPATLAQAATRAEFQQPGSMARAFGGGGGMGGPSFGSMLGSSILGTVAGYVIGSALVSAFMPNDFGGSSDASDASGDSGGDNNNDSAGDPGTDSGTDAGGTTEAAGYGGGWDQGGDIGGDFGGGDFGGGDFF